MALPGIPRAQTALGTIGRLARRKRQAQAGAAFGRAINTQPQGPATNSVSTAATSNPGAIAATTTQQQPGQIGVAAKLGREALAKAKKKKPVIAV